ncbi:MAG: helix-turn-helix transcriptional regulator, partial [Clostridia bacterium]|nr:helix-turn-helix transcriptional regulator [Clostridia bacterium]
MKPTTIGERIRDLRKKRDLTQEKLADFLGVSYQAVSKWECNLTSPDLGLIGPLTKLLGVTSDELLGLTEEENDERKAYFEEAYQEYMRHPSDENNNLLAKQAAAEFPG